MRILKYRPRKGWPVRVHPARGLALGFLALIAAGTVLLSLPAATVDSGGLGLVDALFTATSAVCVTGLAVVDTGTHFTFMGQVVILLLIQMGGLGFMTMTTMVALVLGKRIGLRERVNLQESMNLPALGGLVRLLKRVLVFTLAVQGVGVAVLAWHWQGFFGWPQSLYQAIFHSVSAFCNAGFDLQGEFASLTGWQGDVVVNLVTMGLIVIGGIGFAVVADLSTWPRKRTLGLHTRLVLWVTGTLIALAALFLAVLEWNNPATLGSMEPGQRLVAALFQAITPRTAGFSTVDTASLGGASLLLTLFLMYVGASPGSTGGGIKTTTFAVLVLGVWAYLRGSGELVLFDRRLAWAQVWKSLAIGLLGLALIFCGSLVLLVSENAEWLSVVFEVTSAFGTVGLSLGLTPDLSTLGRVVLAVVMFAGRLGPVTLALALALGQRRVSPPVLHHAPGKVAVG